MGMQLAAKRNSAWSQHGFHTKCFAKCVKHRDLNKRAQSINSGRLGVAVLGAVVPDFPRLSQPFRDFIARDVPNLTGFNANDVVKNFTPDLIDPNSLYTCLLLVSCAAAFVYLEGAALLQDLLQEMDFERLEEKYLEENRDKYPVNMSRRDLTEKERRRGLGWLALVTALSVWCTGVVNKINPFQP